MPRVWNKRRLRREPANAVYVGRPSKWGNPFPLTAYGRDEALRLYKQHLYDSGLINDIDELRGKHLICWCAPRPCHADILLKLANE